MKVLSLFSGGGLGDYGLELAGMEIIGQVEIDEYCQKVLALRWPDVPKWRDVRAVHTYKHCPNKKHRGGYPCNDCLHWAGSRIDLISGGFPCQDISTAGKGAGITGARSGLWKEMLRIIREVRPRYVLVENVTALLSRGLGTVLGDLAEIGYDTEWDCIPASALGAPHQRDRIWIVAWDTNRRDERSFGEIRKRPNSESGGVCEDVANAGREHGPRRTEGLEAGQTIRTASILSAKPSREGSGRFWLVEPNVGRVAHGVAKRVDRLKLLGNGQVVQVVRWVGEQIMRHARHGED